MLSPKTLAEIHSLMREVKAEGHQCVAFEGLLTYSQYQDMKYFGLHVEITVNVPAGYVDLIREDGHIERRVYVGVL